MKLNQAATLAIIVLLSMLQGSSATAAVMEILLPLSPVETAGGHSWRRTTLEKSALGDLAPLIEARALIAELFIAQDCDSETAALQVHANLGSTLAADAILVLPPESCKFGATEGSGAGTLIVDLTRAFRLFVTEPTSQAELILGSFLEGTEGGCDLSAVASVVLRVSVL